MKPSASATLLPAVGDAGSTGHGGRGRRCRGSGRRRGRRRAEPARRLRPGRRGGGGCCGRGRPLPVQLPARPAEWRRASPPARRPPGRRLPARILARRCRSPAGPPPELPPGPSRRRRQEPHDGTVTGTTSTKRVWVRHAAGAANLPPILTTRNTPAPHASTQRVSSPPAAVGAALPRRPDTPGSTTPTIRNPASRPDQRRDIRVPHDTPGLRGRCPGPATLPRS